MKVFFFAGWFPYPPNNGSRIRLYNLIKHLARSHKVYLASLLQWDSNPEDAKHLADVCEVVSLHRPNPYSPKSIKSLLGFFSSRPRSNVASFNPAIKTALADAIRKIQPDVIVVSTLDAAEYLFDFIPGIPAVLIDHNCEFALLKRNAGFVKGKLKQWRYDLGWKKYARWEAGICRRFNAVIMPNPEDKQMMLEFAPDIQHVSVIANAADTELYDPDCWSPDSGQLIYNGALTYSANLDAVRYYASEIYPLVKEQLGGVRLAVTGRTNGVDTRGFDEDSGIQLVGYVDDIRTALYNSAACVIPLRKGGGMRLKIPEAMAAGVPVISTTMGAEGLECVDGVHLLIADTPQAFANAIVQVLTDPALRETLRKNGRELVEQKYSWAISGAAFVDLVEKAAAKERA